MLAFQRFSFLLNEETSNTLPDESLYQVCTKSSVTSPVASLEWSPTREDLLAQVPSQSVETDHEVNHRWSFFLNQMNLNIKSCTGSHQFERACLPFQPNETGHEPWKCCTGSTDTQHSCKSFTHKAVRLSAGHVLANSMSTVSFSLPRWPYLGSRTSVVISMNNPQTGEINRVRGQP